MKRSLPFIAGLIAGMVVSVSGLGFALDTVSPIKLLVNNQEITLPDVQPVVVNGQVMVPLLPFAEVAGLGARWDEANQTVYVTVRNATQSTDAEVTAPLTLDVDGVTYYRSWPLASLIQDKYPDKRIGLSVNGLNVGDEVYSLPRQNAEFDNNHASYLDVRPLIEAEVIDATDLANITQYYGR